jgi:G3E family GTPase
MSVPVVLLTGFLGSGKTTLLSRALQRIDGRGVAVVVNELGEVGLDHHLLRLVAEDVVVLPGGCICCSLRNDLVTTLDELHDAMTRGVVPALTRVVLETTGIADPAPLLSTLAGEARERGRFHLSALVTTVDAVAGAATLGREPEARLQVALADRIVLTKCDDPAAQPAELEVLLDRLAPGVPRVRAFHGDVPTEVLLEAALRDIDGYVRVWLGLEAERADAHRGHVHHDHVHPHGVDRISCTLDEPVSLPAFLLWLSFLTQMDGERVLRVKALVLAEGEPLPLVVQSSQHVVHPVFTLRRWPAGRIATHVTVLTRGLDAARRAAILASLHALAQPRQASASA